MIILMTPLKKGVTKILVSCLFEFLYRLQKSFQDVLLTPASFQTAFEAQLPSFGLLY